MIKRLFSRASMLALTLAVSVVTGAKKVHTLGDSTMATYKESETNTRGWGMYFGNFLTDGWESVNYAKGGRDSRGGYNELWQNAKNNVQAGDYVLIQFAHNDEKFNGMDNDELQAYYTAKGDAANAAAVKKDGRGTVPSTTYKAWLKKIIDEVKAKGATPVLVSAVCRCYFGGDNKITKAGQHNLADRYDALVNGVMKTDQKLSTDDHSMDYTYQMKLLAEQEQVAFVDMTAATKEYYEKYGSYDKCYAALFDKGGEVDKTHYNTKGALMAASLCAQLMKKQGLLADHIVVPTDMAFNPASADMGEVYVGQSATKELTLSAQGLQPLTGTVTISASEGLQLSADKENWQSQLTVGYENGTLIKSVYVKMGVTAAGQLSGTVTATLGSKTVVATVTCSGIELGGGNPFTVTWPLTGGDDAEVNGLATGVRTKIEGLAKHSNSTDKGLLVSTSDGGTWVKAEDDSPNQYVQFSVTAPEGKKLDINHITLRVGAQGGNGLRCHVYYSTDGFVTRETLYAPESMSSGVMNLVDASPVIRLEEGGQLQIRVYPWYTANATGKWLCVRDVQVGGQTKDAAGVKIEGSISYPFDKGGLSQDDDVTMEPAELAVGFAGRHWTAGQQLTVSGTQTYQGAEGEADITQTKVSNSSGSKTAASADAANTMTLTLTPVDGFTFVPTRLSFKAARYGTDGGNISASVDAGATHVDLVTNAGVNRGGKGLTIKSFAEKIEGVTATADKPLKVNFSFLGMNDGKSMGLSDVVIDGTLVGAAAQVTKYALSTSVEPAEAGTVSREPELESYKEGTAVTLKAQKNFGYKFVKWVDADGNTVSADATTTVTVDAEKTVQAVFETVPVYTVTTVTTNDADRTIGTVTLTPNDHEGRYEAGTKITATANESKILKFLSWTDGGENAGVVATRELTVGSDLKLVADYEVQDFIAVFDASKTQSYAYATTEGYPFAADEVWDADRQAQVSVVKMSDGSLVYTKDGGTPVVRNREGVVISSINGIYQNGYRSTDIAFQYRFSTKGFTAATFTADMAAKNMATKKWKALLSTDGNSWEPLGTAWEMTANALMPLSFALPAGRDMVYVRITGDGTETLSDKYAFDKQFDGLDYASNSECGVGNVFVTGEAETVADEVAPQLTAVVPADKATGVSAAGKITVSFDERIVAGPATLQATLNGEPLQDVTWNNRSVSFDYSRLTYGQTYTFRMPAQFVQDRFGNVFADEVSTTFTVMHRPTVQKGLYDAVVTTTEELTAAIKAANSRDDKNSRYRIFVKKGTYKLPTGATKHYKHTDGDGTVTYWEGDLPDPITYVTAANISFIGEDRTGTVITQDISNGAEMLFDGQFGKAHKYEEIGNSAVLQLEGAATGTYFQDITVKSGISDALGRNLAVHDKSSKTIYKNTLLYGYQDTWTSNNQNGLFYFEGGQVRGRTDYLCGKGDAYFNGLELRQMAGGYAAVPSTPKNVGWVFKDCIFSADGSGVNNSFTLGRPWGKGTPVAVFIDTKMNVTPKAEGWNEMSNNWPKRFAEYNSMNAQGKAVSLSARKTLFSGTHQNVPVLTEAEADAYSDMAAMFGDWQPTLATEQAPVPANVVVSGARLTWDASDYVLLWAVCKDGRVVDFTTEPSYNVVEDGTYSVRAANEMGGLSEASQSVAVSTTGISSSMLGADAGEMSDSALYDLQGRRVLQPRRGLYIRERRKVTIK